MASLMLGAALKGLGDAGVSLGNAAMQSARLDEQERERERLQRRRMDVRRDRDGLDASLEAAVAWATSKHGRTKDVDFSEGSTDEESLAMNADMTLPALRELRSANRTGDESVLSKYGKEKRRALGELMLMYRQGDTYDESAKGRQIIQQMGIMDDVLAGRRKPEDVARAEAAVAGKLPFDSLGRSGVFNPYSGSQQLNELGKAEAEDERASAKARAPSAPSSAQSQAPTQKPTRASSAAPQTAPSKPQSETPWKRDWSAGAPASAAVAVAEPAQAPVVTPPSPPTRAITFTAAMEKRIRTEQEEMGMGARLRYSPEVKAALEAAQRQIDAQRLRESQEYRRAELVRARRGGY